MGVLLTGCNQSAAPAPSQQRPSSQNQIQTNQPIVGDSNPTFPSDPGVQKQNITYQTITNDEFKFSFEIHDWTVESRSARNASVYQSPNHHATVNELGFSQSGLTEQSFLDNQEKEYFIPTKPNLSYFADGTKGSWTWLAESWVDSGKINYALIYLNGNSGVGSLVQFQYLSDEKSQWDAFVSHAVQSFVPAS